VKPYLLVGSTEPNRVCIGVEYIGYSPIYAIMISFLWWFIVVGVEQEIL